jgi:hypothetical protein
VLKKRQLRIGRISDSLAGGHDTAADESFCITGLGSFRLSLVIYTGGSGLIASALYGNIGWHLPEQRVFGNRLVQLAIPLLSMTGSGMWFNWRFSFGLD